MVDQEDNFVPRQNFLWRQQSREKIVDLFRTNLFEISHRLFAPTYSSFVDQVSLLSEKASLISVWWINWVEIFCSAAGYIVASPRLCANEFLQRIASLYQWFVRLRRENHNLYTIGLNLELFNQNLKKLTFFVNNPKHFMRLCKEEMKVSKLFKVYTLNALVS